MDQLHTLCTQAVRKMMKPAPCQNYFAGLENRVAGYSERFMTSTPTIV